MTRRAVRSMVAALAAIAVIGAAPAHALVIGVGDQKPDMFADKRFKDLHVRYARLMVPWDVMESSESWQIPALDTWLAAARAAGVEPLISWDHSRNPARAKIRPQPSRFQRDFKRFRARYRWVTTFATWNEANHCGEPLCHREAMAVRYYKALKSACSTCRILAAELLDQPNMVTWARNFIHLLGYQPRYWGLHNYLDANRQQTAGTWNLVHAVTGQIWLTETGGIVKRRNRSTINFPENARNAAKSISWVFDRLVPLSKRITRVYLYHWNPQTTKDTWDSALVNIHGTPRLSYTAFAAEQRKLLARAKRSAGA